MCGIAGIVAGPGTTLPQGIAAAMLNKMAHRGPDADGIFAEPHLQIGHKRLSILDPDPRGNQPMHSADERYVLSFNGEIYNFKEIRAELDYPFRTETDTEMVLAAYEKWGPDCLKRFNGMFALAIWDRQDQVLFIARDRLGIKPLYVHHDKGQLSFASEVRSLLQVPGLRRKLNRNSLPSFLTYQTVYGNSTLIEGISMLPPGHFMQWKAGAPASQPTEYWNIWKNADRSVLQAEEKDVHTRLLELLRSSVSRRMISDVPLGAFLSGGIDSSAIVALMAQSSNQPVDTFSVIFQEKAYDESTWSEMVARKYNTRHHPILLKPADFLEALPSALQAMDHPSGDGINSYVVSQVTRAQGVKVALSGLGGDELFAGYPIFTQLPGIRQRAVMKLPLALRKPLAGLYGLLKSGRQADKVKALLALRDASLSQVYPVYRTIYDWPDAWQMAGVQPTHPLEAILADMQTHGHQIEELSRISGLEIQSYTGAVLLRDTDQMSMAHALEVRVPFFDHELVEFGMGLTDQVKRPHYPKKVLVEALGDLLPDEVVHRKKMGFVFPWEQWLRGELHSFCDTRIHRLEQRGIFPSGRLSQIWKEFQAKKGPWLWTHIWLPVVLEEWMHNNRIEA